MHRKRHNQRMFIMPLNNRLSLAVAAVLGVGIYYCEWLDVLTSSEVCTPGLVHFFRMYLAPIVVAAVLGLLLGTRYKTVHWIAFIGPSFVLRQLQFFLLPSGFGNLWPLSIAVDILVAFLTLAAIHMTSKVAAKEAAPPI